MSCNYTRIAIAYSTRALGERYLSSLHIPSDLVTRVEAICATEIKSQSPAVTMEEESVKNNGAEQRLAGPIHETGHQFSILRRLFDQSSNQPQQGKEENEKALHEAKTRVENNIETLDYLRGISCLERDFVHLAEKVVKISLQLAHNCGNINREAFSSTRIAQEVDNSWQHINHLGFMLETHVKHAKRYHLFNLEAENLELRLRKIEFDVESVVNRQTPTEAAVNNISSEMHQILESLIQAFVNWQNLNQQKNMVCPLHRRVPLPSGVHSGVLMIAISLPSADGKSGSILRAGTRVHVRASRPADVLHREWFLVDPTREGEHGGLVIASVPAAFVWLDSTDAPLKRASADGKALVEEKNNRRSRSVASTPRTRNNDEMVEDLRKYLFRVWEKCCSKFDQILREIGTTLLEKAQLADSQLKPLSKEELNRLDKALQKITGLVKMTEFQRKGETERLRQLLDAIKSKQGEYANVDVNAADALLQAIDIFEELAACNQNYSSLNASDAIPMNESGNNWQETLNKLDTSPRSSMEAPIQYRPVTYDDPIGSKTTRNITLKPPDLIEYPKPALHTRRHRSLTNDSYGEDNDFSSSPDSSAGNADHSVSRVSRSLKEEKSVDLYRSPSKNRRRDRFYRFLPILLRRHTQSKKVSTGGSEFSDNEVSRNGRRTPSTPPKTLPRSYESLSLGRINYLKKSDFHRLHRTPLPLSTSINEGSTPTKSSALRGQELHRDCKPPSKPRLFYSTACQNGVCVNSEIAKIEQPGIEEPAVCRVGKKLQVGMSFIANTNQAERLMSPEMIQRQVYNPLSHVYANIDPQRASTLNQSISNLTLYDMGIQVDLPNRLRGLRCRLEFDQPGVELGGEDNFSCEAYNQRYNEQNASSVEGEEAGGANRNSRTLSFRVAFNNRPTRCASTI